jgi:hypothetical protein
LAARITPTGSRKDHNEPDSQAKNSKFNYKKNSIHFHLPFSESITSAIIVTTIIIDVRIKHYHHPHHGI